MERLRRCGVDVAVDTNDAEITFRTAPFRFLAEMEGGARTAPERLLALAFGAVVLNFETHVPLSVIVAV